MLVIAGVLESVHSGCDVVAAFNVIADVLIGGEATIGDV
jgi:hypothetical protein